MNGPITTNGITPILNVRDIQASLNHYRDQLRFEIDWQWGDPTNFASVSLDQTTIFLCEQGQGAFGTWLSLFLDDVDAYHEIIKKDPKVNILHPPQDEPWGCREMKVEDLDGHTIRFTHSLPNVGAPLTVTRTSVNARIESRLAALLEDLARHKKMTIGEMLEETILHTFEPIGKDGVASPHTRGTLHHINELKKKHGIDYDCHASYRFRE